MANRDISKRVADRQSALAAAADSAPDDQAWVDDISQFNEEDFDSR